MTILPENPNERRMFDSGLTLFAGNKIAYIAATLKIWADQERHFHPGGSFGEQCAIMANELHKMCVTQPDKHETEEEK